MRTRGARVVGAAWGALLISGCEADQPTANVELAAAPAAAMVGEWTHTSAPRARESPSLNAGLTVTIVIDSADGAHFRGRVTLWFAGDVGLSPEAFGPVAGSVDGEGGVTLVIPSAASGGPPLTVLATIAPSALTVLESRLGGEPGPFPPGARFERTHPLQEDP